MEALKNGYRKKVTAKLLVKNTEKFIEKKL